MEQTKISITKLFGDRNISVTLNEDVTIINAENGKGKTTALQFIYAILTGKLNLLLRYDFESIVITRNNVKYKIAKSDMFLEFSAEFKKIRELIGEEDSYKLMNIVSKFPEKDSRNIFFRNMAREVASKHGLPSSYVMKIVDSIMFASDRSGRMDLFEENKVEWKNAIDKFHEDNVIFWPTYRRVEKSMKIEQGDQIDSSESFAFGMADIEKKLAEIEKGLSADALSLTANMNRDLIVDTLTEKRPPEKFYKTAKNRLQEIKLILDRTKILKEKEHLIDLIETNALRDDRYLPLAQIIYRLLEGFEALAKKDEKIKRFVYAVNNYLAENELVYDDRTVQIFCRNKYSYRPIRLEHLSSGEKHIVSFMSQLYLFEEAMCVIIIDEPELSLSSDWQEKLLVDIMKSGQVKKLICATHSPFIFNNIYDGKAVPLFTEVVKNVTK